METEKSSSRIVPINFSDSSTRKVFSRTGDRKEQVSYYDKQDGLKYTSEKKNLNKIRSKTLRNFCKFYETLTLLPYIQTISGNEIIPINDLLFNTEGAGKNIVYNQIQELNESGISQEIFEKVRLGFSKRTIYDYMNTLKFIRAVNKGQGELSSEILGLLGNCQGMTKIKEEIKK